MAEGSASERTEKPTAERLRKAREEGRIPQSEEVGSALVTVAMLVALSLSAAHLHTWMCRQIQDGTDFHYDSLTQAGFLPALLAAKGRECLGMLVPFLAAVAGVSFLASLLSGGWAFSPKAVKLDFSRVALGGGMKNLFSLRSLVHLGFSLAKLAIVLLLVWTYLRDKLDDCMALQYATAEGMLTGMSRLILGVLTRVCVALAAIALLDLLFQRWRYVRDLKMSRQEVKEERKQYELAPEVRSRIRRIQIEMVRRRMLVEVPKADVIIANPTHVAVALRYRPGAMEAPVVVAKGADLLCEKIKEIARNHNVPIVHRPELARTLYATLDVGAAIPETLFVAVAEVLALIYRLKKGRSL